MSKQYPGGIISKTAPVPSGSFENSTAPGIWTLEQQSYWQKLGQWPIPGNVPQYIENVFSTYLYSGNSGNQTITNGINLSGNGGLAWIKSRTNTTEHWLIQSVNTSWQLASNSTHEAYSNSAVTLESTGFSLVNNSNVNASGQNYVSWTFQKKTKFFDMVTWTGDGTEPRTINHNLGSTPGMMIVKRINSASEWAVYHRSLGATKYMWLNDTTSADTSSGYWANTEPTSTNFTVGSGGRTNGAGNTYVGYFFAHNAGGFGLTGTDNVISCGSYTGNGSTVGPTVTLGWEPQWLMVKKATSIAGSEGWAIWANVRNSGLWNDWIMANEAGVENVNNSNVAVQITSTGFFPNATNNTANSYVNTSGATYIYIAVRRGPMATPTVGTSVYQANTYTGNATLNTTVAGNFGFPVDLMSLTSRDATATNFDIYGQFMLDRLQGQDVSLGTATTRANTEGWNNYHAFNVKNSIGWGLYGSSSETNYMNNSGGLFVARGFKRAPSFFDIVCYTGVGSATTFSHNLTVVPEMMIVKRRSTAGSDWWVYNANLGNTKALRFTTESAFTLLNIWNDTTPTSSVFTVGADSAVNGGGSTYVNYLFATCAGVSKVGSYTGTGTTQVINCGFTSGARFVLIKRSDSTGDWYVWDSATGIVAGNDPYILLNSAAAQVTNTDYIDTAASGFEISSTAPAAINANGGTFIFLAIA